MALLPGEFPASLPSEELYAYLLSCKVLSYIPESWGTFRHDTIVASFIRQSQTDGRNEISLLASPNT